MHKAFKACTAVLLALVMTVSLVNGALAAVVRNDDDTISYEPLEQGVYSKGGYTIDKVSHPTLGAGEVDGIRRGGRYPDRRPSGPGPELLLVHGRGR